MLKTEPKPASKHPHENHAVDFHELLQVFFDKLWLIVAVTLIALIAGATYAYRSPAIYQAKLVLEVEQEDKKFISIEEIAPQDLRSSEMLNTIVQSIKSGSVLQRVAQKNNLVADRSFWLSATNAPTEAEVVRRLAKLVDVKLRRQTRLIDVTVEHTHPETARRLANSIADEFIHMKVEQRFDTTQVANEFLVQEAGKLKAKLERSEQAAQDYKEKNQTVSLEERQNIDMDKLKELNLRYSEAKSARLQFEVDNQEIKKVANQPDLLLNIPAVANNPAVMAAKTKLTEAEASLTSATLRYKEKHPAMLQARSQVTEMKEALRKKAISTVDTVKLNFESALAKERSFEIALRDQEMLALGMNKKAIQFNVLSREVESDRTLYDSVLKRLKETNITKAIEKNNLRIVEAAALPVTPVKPQKLRILLGAFLGGLALSLGLVQLLNKLDTSIKSVDRAEKILGLPVLGAIPKTKTVHGGKDRLVAVNEPEGICSEAFRSLRANISLLGREGERRITVITSAIPADGKTFSCVNYAVTLAQQGHRTLVIDFDLRKPSLAESFHLPNELPGVSNYLLGKDKLENLVQTSPYENLFLLTAGQRVPNPAELFSIEWVSQLLREALQQFDRVIIDTAPINAVSDTLPVMHLADTVCIVARAGRTSSRAVLRAIETLRRANASPSGVVLNFLTGRHGPGYYYYYSEKEPYGGKGVYGSAYNSKQAA